MVGGSWAATTFRLYNAILVQKAGRLVRNSTVSSQRCLSSSSGEGDKGDDDKTEDPAVSPKKGSVRKRRPVVHGGGDPAVAKSKLNDLLTSIMKDQEERSKLNAKEKQDENKIEFKLARKEAVKPSQEELIAAAEDKAAAKVIGTEILTAAKKVAESMPGDPKIVENELVKRLKTHTSTKINLSELFEGMKVDKTPGHDKPPSPREPSYNEFSRAGRVRQDMRGQRPSYRDRDSQSSSSRPPQDRRTGRISRSTEDLAGLSYRPIDIFGANPLGMFTKLKSPQPSAPISYLKTWDALHAKELKLAATHPPKNGLEEMILWTEQGKLWHFPINNEQGLDAEAKFSFTDHIFLEPHLEPWCPKKGPIRHFMELVCVGLSKNPYLTVQDKKDQIEWYHIYFMGKAKIIKDVGAGEIK